MLGRGKQLSGRLDSMSSLGSVGEGPCSLQSRMGHKAGHGDQSGQYRQFATHLTPALLHTLGRPMMTLKHVLSYPDVYLVLLPARSCPSR